MGKKFYPLRTSTAEYKLPLALKRGRRGGKRRFFSIFLLVCLFVRLFLSFFEDLTFNNVRGTHGQFIGDKIVD